MQIQTSSSPPSQSNPNLKVRAAILEAVEHQLDHLDPPETKQTYDRLCAEGHSSDEAKRLIAYALLSEMNDMMKTNRVFDQARYAEILERLPALS
ncbi:MAG: DUF1841 family protein [Elainellaceae cyanobacterium]